MTVSSSTSGPQHLGGRPPPPPPPVPHSTDNNQRALTPAQRRKKAVRDQLKETAEIAALLLSGDDAPVPPTLATDPESCCRLGQTKAEEITMKCLKSYIDSGPTVQNNNQYREKLTKLARNACRLFLLSSSSSSLTKDEKDSASESNEGKDISPETPLLVHYAAVLGNTAALECLFSIDSEAFVLANKDGETVLHLAVRYCHIEAVRSICERAPQCCRVLGGKDEKRLLPLHYALGMASIQTHESTPFITSTLLANYPRGIMIRNGNGYLPIHLAAQNGFMPGIRGLLAVDASGVFSRLATDDQDNDDNDALPVDLAIEGHRRIVERLAASSLSTTTTTTNNNKTWLLADKDRYEECIEVLLLSALARRAVFMPRDETHVDGSTAPFFVPLHAALCARLQPSSWEHLWKIYGGLHGCDADRDGRTLLHAVADACCHDDDDDDDNDQKIYPNAQLCDIIREVHHREPTAYARKDIYGLVPLQLAVLNGADATVVKAILECGQEMTRAKWVV